MRYKDTMFTFWESGGDDKIRNLWYAVPPNVRSACATLTSLRPRRHHYEGLDCLIYVVDSSDHKRVEENKNELWMMLSSEDLKDVMLLVIANKQDKAEAMSSAEIAETLKLHNIPDRKWFIQGTCATTGDGIFTALDWLQFQLE